MHKTFGRDKMDIIRNKYSKKDGGPIDEIIDRTGTLRNTNQSFPEETIAEIIKLRRKRAERLKRQKEERLKMQELENSKQFINQTSNIISTNNSSVWKQFKKAEK